MYFPPKNSILFVLLLTYLLVFLFQEWDGISSEAKNLISHLLVRDATKRYTTDMILQNPWIEEVMVLFLTFFVLQF